MVPKQFFIVFKWSKFKSVVAFLTILTFQVQRNSRFSQCWCICITASHFLNQKWYLFYFFRIYIFRFDNVLQVLSCIIQFIINVAISGSESYGNALNLRRLFNSVCKRINQIVLFNLRKYFKTKNGAIFRYLKENFILGGTPLFMNCTSNLLGNVSKDSHHDAVVSFCISYGFSAFNRDSQIDFIFLGFSEVHLNSDEKRILEMRKQKFCLLVIDDFSFCTSYI